MSLGLKLTGLGLLHLIKSFVILTDSLGRCSVSANWGVKARSCLGRHYLFIRLFESHLSFGFVNILQTLGTGKSREVHSYVASCLVSGAGVPETVGSQWSELPVPLA